MSIDEIKEEIAKINDDFIAQYAVLRIVSKRNPNIPWYGIKGRIKENDLIWEHPMGKKEGESTTMKIPLDMVLSVSCISAHFLAFFFNKGVKKSLMEDRGFDD